MEKVIKNHKIRYILCILSFCFCLPLHSGDKNPFYEMADKKYGEYSYDLREEFGRFMALDSAEASLVVRQLTDVSRACNKSEWALVAEFFALSHPSILNTTTYEEIIDRTKILAEKARKINASYLLIQSWFKIAFINRYALKNYEIAFEYYRLIDKELQNISQDDFPEKVEYYYDIADYYYQFGDYVKAAKFFRKILDNKMMPYSERVFIHARNGLGLCARYNDNDLDESDKWFNSILEMEMSGQDKETRYDQWAGIANGNLGHNMYLRKKYDDAIPLLSLAYDKALVYDDYAYAARTATTLADSYRNLKKMVDAKKYIDLSQKLFHKTGHTTGQYRHLYAVMSKYYSGMNDSRHAIEYMDSTLNERAAYNKHFNALQLLRAEQRAGVFEQKAKEEELRLEKAEKKALLKNLIIVSAGLLLLIILLILYHILYCKKRTAYRELVRLSKEWANSEKENKLPRKSVQNGNNGESGSCNDEKNWMIMNQFYTLVVNDKIYKSPDLTLDIVAEKLNVNRVYLSQAINQTTGSNFTTFINENRIKEAIKMMSGEQAKNLSLDGIAFETGFNDRVSFYRAFKKVTGITPSEFRKNMKA